MLPNLRRFPTAPVSIGCVLSSLSARSFVQTLIPLRIETRDGVIKTYE